MRNESFRLSCSSGLLFFILHLITYAQTPTENFQYYLANELPLEGKGWGETAGVFSRLPEKWQAAVSNEVWRHSLNSAGLAVTFQSDASVIKVRWRPRRDNHMPHMTDIGTKGSDLYAWSEKENAWRWVGSSKNWGSGPNYEATLTSGLDSCFKKFLLYLPLYDGLDSLWLGVPSQASIRPFKRSYKIAKPVVFYGTSITQGGCASRPGMTYPAIIGRRLDVATINLGFSGAGKMELPMAQLLAEIDAAAYVIDCLPNMTPEMVNERVVPFIRELRRLRPTTPIILVSSIEYENAWDVAETAQLLRAKNENLLQAYKQLTHEKVKRLYLIKSSRMNNLTLDATVDGVHLTDLGFTRLADKIIPYLRKALKS